MAPHIAHFIDTQDKGGAEVTLMDLAIYQKNAGYEVFVFHHNNAYISNLCQRHGIKAAPFPAYKYYKHTYTLPLYAVAFARTLRTNKIDVLHSHLFGPITGNAIATKLSGTRHIGTLHDIYMIEEKPARAKLLLLSHKLGTQLICVSKDMASFYQQHLAISNDKLVTVYNASQINPLPSDDTRRNIYQQHAFTNTDIILSTVGRLVPLKRIDWIIKAISSIDKTLIDRLKFLIIGDGPEKDHLLTLSKKLLPGKVSFTGEVSNVSDFLNLSDIYIQFSSTEGLSRSIIEALSCQLPCIVSDVGGNRELVINNSNGYIIPADDIQQLTAKLNLLIKDNQSRRRFGQASFTHFNKNCDFKQFQNAYLKLYNV